MGTKSITYTGKIYDAGRPDASVVDVADVAHSLSMTCRYGGHASDFYSVAEHSVLVYREGSRIFNDKLSYTDSTPSREKMRSLSLALLLHDAPEVYLDDAVSPFKERDDMAWYRDLEEQWMRAICAAFAIGGEVDRSDWDVVRRVDRQVRDSEMAFLFPHAPRDVRSSWGFDYGGLPLKCWSPAMAKRTFLYTFNQIEAAR